MKDLALLRSFAGKVNGQNFDASDWNSFVDTVIGSELFGSAFAKTGTCQTDNGNPNTIHTGNSESILLESGHTYRLAGSFDCPIVIIPGASEDEPTRIILDNCFIKSTGDFCIKSESTFKLEVNIAAGTRNILLVDNAEGENLSSVISADDDIDITGTGLLYIGSNKFDHGVKAQKLKLKGDTTILVDVNHDAFHASQVLDIFHGHYHILNANDAFGSGERETGEETKLRGIVRVFGGKMHIHNITGVVFDAKYEKMTKGSDGLYYADDDTLPSGVTTEQVYNSGFHSYHYIVDGPGVTSQNLSENFTDQTPKAADASVTVGGVAVEPTQDTDGNDIYTIDTASAEVLVTGYVKGTIVCAAQKIEVHLNHAIIEAPAVGDNAGVAIRYTLSSKNVQVQSENGSEGNYIFGTIQSANNVKLTPKGDSVLHIEAPGVGNGEQWDGVGVNGSSIIYNNGGGSIFITGCKIGAKGTEHWIGNDDDANREGKQLKGDIYVFGNTECDMVARLNSSGTKKGCIYVTSDFEGNAYAGTIKTAMSHNLDANAISGSIVGEYIDSNYPVIRANKLYYQHTYGCAVVTNDAAVQYGAIDGQQMISNLA